MLTRRRTVKKQWRGRRREIENNMFEVKLDGTQELAYP